MDPGPGEHQNRREVIARCFSAESVAEIIARLESEQGRDADWAREVAAELKQRAPLSLVVTHRHIRESRTRDLRQVLEMDFRLACRFLEDRDFYEGVRAVVIEKDNAPAWSPASVQQVTREMLERYFDLAADPSWTLPTRGDMQAMRA
jgi:enoyl-CoA hydratase